MAGGQVTPLIVTATMQSAVECMYPIMLDGLLASVVARERGLIAPRSADEVEPIDIPIQREPGGRFHLCSEAHHSEKLFSRLTHVHKRAPVQEYSLLCSSKVRRVDMTGGVDKSWRVPRSGEFFRELSWWCIGDAEAIRVLLRDAVHIGARRRHGCGRVQGWRVEPSTDWPGFPVIRDGFPLRALPLDYPGLTGGRRQLRALTYPYWLQETWKMLKCP